MNKLKKIRLDNRYTQTQAAKASGGHVVGLATTYPRERIRSLCEYVMDDFRGFDVACMVEKCGGTPL